MSSSVRMRLYRLHGSTNVERVALALAYKGIEVESIWVESHDREPVEQVSGQPLVPVIEEDGEIVFDSTAILRYLERHYPEPPLYPRDEARRAEMDIYIDWFNRVWKRSPIDLEAVFLRGQPDEDHVAVLAEGMATHLDLHEALLGGRDYVFGSEFSAADCAAFPFLKYALGRDPGDEELFHRILDEYQTTSGRPRLRAWIERIDERPRA
jgi:glutathione S-transferase